ncbi:MAG TPA: heavy metal translocating P-type ATPase, partial [Armatimonadota bacterium]|nr:heavy metal translocating P-type ATPase [Armatimonadota bacterium]
MNHEHMAHGEHAVHGGPGRHAGHDINVLRKRFWVTLILTIPVVLYSAGIQRLLHFTAPRFPGSEYVPALLGTFIFFYGGIFFIKAAVGELRNRLPGMMTLIS